MHAGSWFLLDVVLALLAVGLGWASISSANPKRGVVLFIAFGLLLALIWARLRAPDVALAEAGIGAGLSGALLLTAINDQEQPSGEMTVDSKYAVWVINVLTLALAGVLAWAFHAAVTIGEPLRLADDVLARLGDSGVSNPVTAVLLNFRAHDTLLELAVLLVAVLGIVSLGPERVAPRPAGPILRSLVTWLTPLLIVMAGYLLWIGAHAPGGAFQAGALLAAVGVLLRVSGRPGAGLPSPAWQRGLLVFGVGSFLVVGVAVMVGDRAFLQYPAEWAGVLILAIEVAATLAIGATLAMAYVGGRPASWQAEFSAVARGTNPDPN